MEVFRSRLLGISVAVAHGVFSGSLNILLKFLISNYQFGFLTLIQFLTSFTAMLVLESLRRLGRIQVPPFGMQLAKVGAEPVLDGFDSEPVLVFPLKFYRFLSFFRFLLQVGFSF